ncbi:hypothetical protein M011DRAFT_180811 [Sporormia fimetaria CBS 119925]|uniref:Uncharacterized protein n=1 Tax=Sporormia fimetaria CBS 119925 TaxID=1340428 RepID=A0A6A6VMC1_9PLEO|nr:hypothetical protein M011DRAFT_180811 [Sporormia fimetaria CBS 119925]
MQLDRAAQQVRQDGFSVRILLEITSTGCVDEELARSPMPEARRMHCDSCLTASVRPLVRTTLTSASFQRQLSRRTILEPAITRRLVIFSVMGGELCGYILLRFVNLAITIPSFSETPIRILLFKYIPRVSPPLSLLFFLYINLYLSTNRACHGIQEPGGTKGQSVQVAEWSIVVHCNSNGSWQYP